MKGFLISTLNDFTVGMINYFKNKENEKCMK